MSSIRLTEYQIALVEESFAAVAPRGAAFVAIFYRRLFHDYPELKPLFAEALQHEQQKKLLGSLVLVVENLRSPEKLQPVLQQLGARHGDYEVKPEHYPAFGKTLLKTLAECAGDIWGSELEEAWSAAFGVISKTMMEAAVAANV